MLMTMKRSLVYSLLSFLLFSLLLNSQNATDASKDVLFDSNGESTESESGLMTLRLVVPIKTLKKETNDSTYIESTLFYKEDAIWDSLPAEFRTRGDFMLKKFVLPPVKIKFSKADIEETVFYGNKKLKLVVPCRHEDDKNDNVVKEYMAYKLFEPMTPYHFKTRLVDLEWPQKANKNKSGFQLKGILLEDIAHVADRGRGKEFDRVIHPMRLDTLNAIRNAFFQYMIGNNDYSVVLGHNRKALFHDNKFLVLPYDFDRSGLVNADYGKSSDVQNLRFMGDEPADRVYRDSPRNPDLVQQIRREYLDNKDAIIEAMNETRQYFENDDEFAEAELYINQFFDMLEDDKVFERRFLTQVHKP